jgi:hypothetical protein
VLHLPHEVADEGLQVAELGAVLGGDDEAELVAIAGAAFEERLAVGIVDRRVIEAARFSFPGDAVTLDVAQVRSRRPEIAALEPHHPGLDDDSPPPGSPTAERGDAALSAPASDPRAGEARRATEPSGRADRFLGGAQDAGDVGDGIAAFASSARAAMGASWSLNR